MISETRTKADAFEVDELIDDLLVLLGRSKESLSYLRACSQAVNVILLK